MLESGRFAGVDFAATPVIQWTRNGALELDTGFRCVRAKFNSYWKRGRIARECGSHIGRCWIIHHNNHLAGYITLLTDKLSVPRRLLHGEQIEYRTFPAVKVGLLAADRRAKGVGTRLMEWAMLYVAGDLSPFVGVRFLTVDALYDPDTGYDSSRYYHEKFGFEFARPGARLPRNRSYREMFLDLRPLIDMVHGSP